MIWHELSRSKNCNVELLTIKDDLLNDYGFYKNVADSVSLAKRINFRLERR